jgi:hypothetical protein
VVSADLSFTVDLGNGPIEGHVSADGGTSIRVTTDDADTVFVAATSVPEIGNAVLPYLADTLADNGLTMEVVGPQGRVVTVGEGASSGWGRLLTGSRAVAPGDPQAVRALVLAQIKRERVRIGLAAAAVVALAVAVGVAVREARS